MARTSTSRLRSRRPEGAPNEVVVDGDPQALLEQLRDANRGGDVHLVGGPAAAAETIEVTASLGALDGLAC